MATEATLEVPVQNRAALLREIVGEEQFNALVAEIREAVEKIDQMLPEELAGVDPAAIEDARTFLTEVDANP